MDFLLLFWEYFKIGLFTIGGGYAMLPLVRQIVERHGWISYDQMIGFVAISESCPGPFAINLATFVGLEVGKSTPLGLFGGFLGAITATIAVVLPSLIIVILVTKLFDRFRTSKIVQGMLYGIRPIVVGLILSSVFSIMSSIVLPDLKLKAISKEGFDTFNYVSLILLIAVFPLSRIKVKGKKPHPILLIIFSAMLGIVLFGVFEFHL